MVKSNRLDHLDMLRGIAAFLVLSGHLRAYLFQSFGELTHADAPTLAFYFITMLGHQAVIIFFALSGFLVGGKALQDISSHRFVWLPYILRRLTRLWIVIIPTLALTFIFDLIGSSASHGLGYDGSLHHIYWQGPSLPSGADHSLDTFLGNLLFIQTILVPCFGSNGPMWSLANEFWYYIVIPLAAWILIGSLTTFARLTSILVLVSIIAFLPIPLLVGGAIWLAGAISAYIVRLPRLLNFFRHVTTRIVVLTCLGAVLVLAKTNPNSVGDYKFGFTVAIALPVLATLPSPGGLYSKLAHTLSELSYTLYLTHFPLLTMFTMANFAPHRFPPNAYSVMLYTSLLFVAVGWAAVVWWFFERNTDRLYHLLMRRYRLSLASDKGIPAAS